MRTKDKIDTRNEPMGGETKKMEDFACSLLMNCFVWNSIPLLR